MDGTAKKYQIIIDVNGNGEAEFRELGREMDKTGKKGKKSVDGIGKTLDGMNAKTKSSIGLFGKLGSAISAAGIGYAVKRIGESSIAAASDLEETGSKFETVFKDQMALAGEWAKSLQDDYAMSRRESKQYLSSIQDLLVPMGMAADQAGRMSNEVVKLSADLGSFNNQLTSTVMDDYQSALVGNYETMKKYGVVLNAAVVEEKAFQMGLADTKDELTASDKAMAAHQLIIEGSTAAIGDMKRTADGYANTSKDLSATIEDLSSTIGNTLLPTATQVKRELSDWIEANEELIGQRVGEYVERFVGAMKDGIDWMGEHGETIKTTAGAVATLVIEYGKFWAISKVIAKGYALVTFFQTATASIQAMAAGTAALTTALKANILALGFYAGYKFGEGMTALATGTWGIRDEIEKDREWANRLKRKYAEELAAIEAKEKAERDEYQKTLLMEERINKEIEATERKKQIAADKTTAAYKTLYEAVGDYSREYYAILKDEIEEEKKKFIEAGVTEVEAQRYYLAQMAALDEEFKAREFEPYAERAAQAVEAANAEKDALTERLSEYQAFYGELQNLIRENAALEKQHISELMALERQRSDLRLSTESMIRSLRETQMDPLERYRSQRSGLSGQYAEAMSLSGQEQVAALESYKQAVSALASQYSAGIKAESSMYGMPGDRYAVSSRQVIEDAISDIQRAANVQQQALADLDAEKQRQIEADRTWGAELSKTARDVADEMASLESDILSLSDSINELNQTVSVDADISRAETAIRQLENNIAAMRRAAEKPIYMTIYQNVVPGGSFGGDAAASAEGSHAGGTRWIPKTGLYRLHQGEAVLNPREVKRDLTNGVTIKGDIVFNIDGRSSIQDGKTTDWRRVIREEVVPELNRLGVSWQK